MKLKFIGATESVTGSKHLVLTEKGKQILLDCGLYQGLGKITEELNRKIDVAPENIEAVILSHAHIDHSGNLPLLVKQGFMGKIYCTPATLDVCEVLLLDSAHIHESDIAFINKRRTKKGMPLLKPLYTVKDAEKCLKHFKTVPFDTEFNLNDEISFHYTENGHIIGSASVNLTCNENGKITKLAFTGDVGRYNDSLLKTPSPFSAADYIISESTYGDRLHEKLEDVAGKVLKIVLKTCVEKKGKLIIPAFSLGRTQEILFELNKLRNKDLLPDIKVYVDSPMSTMVTGLVKKHPESFNESLRKYIETDPDPFGFPGLKYIQSSEESKGLNDLKDPCIIISASGMGDAGRVKHHIKNSITEKRNTILITGYCSPHTLGGHLMAGDKQVHIFGDYFDVNADVESILSYSAHGDYPELIRFLSCQDKTKVKKVFLVHGDPHAKIAFQEKLLAEGYKDVVIPAKGETFSL